MAVLKRWPQVMQQVLGVYLPASDPTVPWTNPFVLLKLNESDSDAEIIRGLDSALEELKRKQTVISQQSPELGAELFMSIQGTVQKIKNDPGELPRIREELKRTRTNVLRPHVQAMLGAQDVMTRSEAEKALRPLITSLGFPPDTVDDALQDMLNLGKWSPDSAGPSAAPQASPSGSSAVPQASPSSGGAVNPFFTPFRLGRVQAPVWAAMPVIGLLAGLAGVVSGAAFGLAVFLLMAGMVLHERRSGAVSPWRNLKWATPTAAAALVAGMLVQAGSVVGGSENAVAVGPSNEPLVAVAPPDAPFPEYLMAPVTAAAADGVDASVLTDGDLLTSHEFSGSGDDGIELAFAHTVPVDGVILHGGVAPTAGGRGGMSRLALVYDTGDEDVVEFESSSDWQVMPLPLRNVRNVRIVSDGGSLDEFWLLRSTETAPSPAWSGTWESTWGPVVLRREGSWVIGEYGAAHEGQGIMVLKPVSESELLGVWISASRDNGQCRVRLIGGRTFSGQWCNGYAGGMEEIEEDQLSQFRLEGRKTTK